MHKSSPPSPPSQRPRAPDLSTFRSPVFPRWNRSTFPQGHPQNPRCQIVRQDRSFRQSAPHPPATWTAAGRGVASVVRHEPIRRHPSSPVRPRRSAPARRPPDRPIPPRSRTWRMQRPARVGGARRVWVRPADRNQVDGDGRSHPSGSLLVVLARRSRAIQADPLPAKTDRLPP